MNNKNFKVIKHLGMLSSPAGDTAKTVYHSVGRPGAVFGYPQMGE